MLTENLKHKKIKDVRNNHRWAERTPDFHVDGLEEATLVELMNGGLDDVQSFNCSMYNFGDMDDLPDSDRDMIADAQTCKEYRH